MKNTYKLIWSDEALNGLKEIISYLEQNFSKKDVRKFARKLEKQLDILKRNPESCPFTPKSKLIRRAIIA